MRGVDERRARGTCRGAASGVAAERRLADRAHAPGRREDPRDRPHPAREQRQRDEEPADQPDRVLEQVPERPGRAVADERDREQEAAAARSRARSPTIESAEERAGARCGASMPNSEPAPEQRRRHRVDADRAIASVTGSSTSAKLRRRADEQLERPVPALALQRAARGSCSSPTRSPSPRRRATRTSSDVRRCPRGT